MPACTNIDIDQAKKLSSAGVTSSATLQTEAKVTASRATAAQEARVFELVLATGQIKALRDDDFVAEGQQLDRLAKQLRKRANALAGLVETYKSFKDLTDYGASDETGKAAIGFFASTNDFLQAVQALPAGAGGDFAKNIPPISPRVAPRGPAFTTIRSTLEKYDGSI